MTTDHNELRKSAYAVLDAANKGRLSDPADEFVMALSVFHDHASPEMVLALLDELSSLTARAQAAEGEAERLAHHMDTCAHDELFEQNEAAWQALGLSDYEGEDDLAHFITGIKGQVDALYDLAVTEANEFKDGTVIDTFKRIIAEVAEAVKAEAIADIEKLIKVYEIPAIPPEIDSVKKWRLMRLEVYQITKRRLTSLDTETIVARVTGQAATSRQKALADLRERIAAAIDTRADAYKLIDECTEHEARQCSHIARNTPLELEAKREEASGE